MWGGAITRMQLHQTISRLQTLDKLPEVPRENLAVPEEDHTRYLSVLREKEIASNLAFLSATSDESLKVRAVCVEEHPNGEEITIRIASNTGDLSAVVREFIVLAKILEKAAQRENSKAEDTEALFRQVIVLDLHRVLSRLRSRHGKTWKTTGKAALITQLHNAINDKPVQTRSGLTPACLKDGRDRAQALHALFTKLEGMSDLCTETARAHELVAEIVKQVHEFPLATLSAALQSSVLDPSLMRYLPEALGKLGSYYSVAIELICAARHRTCRVFKKVHVEPYQIQKPSSLQEASGKVHAEIQLLFFYELHPRYQRPRFICSSKSACYLCNLFFTLHGGFHVPRTHGKLYGQWTLPDWLEVPVDRHRELSVISAQLIATLDSKVQRALELKRKKRYNFPNESVLLPVAHWSSSTLSRKLSIHNPSSTIQPPPSIQEGDPSALLCDNTPLTPPRTPRESSNASNSDPEARVHLSKAMLAGDATSHTSTSSDVSRITISHKELPHSQLVTLTTPSLHLQLDKLFLTLDFLKVSSGRLVIAQAEEATVSRKGYYAVNIEDIPATTELQLSCPQNSNELTFHLHTTRKGIVRISFVWDGV
ncbi:MAG: hypothetical protein M1829_000952 [Trizodia sp. TS-e1964]|nr:MAG: hypothetical protein M1829_000952 [Trizodia sp. TS-e1964]